jgi:hypothetical protein
VLEGNLLAHHVSNESVHPVFYWLGLLAFALAVAAWISVAEWWDRRSKRRSP